MHASPATSPHTCHTGPLCGFWDQPGQRNGSADDSYPTCGHGSCEQVLHEQCEACQREAYEGEPGAYCPQGHGWQQVTASGHNPGHGWMTVYHADLACGCQLFDER